MFHGPPREHLQSAPINNLELHPRGSPPPSMFPAAPRRRHSAVSDQGITKLGQHGEHD